MAESPRGERPPQRLDCNVASSAWVVACEVVISIRRKACLNPAPGCAIQCPVRVYFVSLRAFGSTSPTNITKGLLTSRSPPGSRFTLATPQPLATRLEREHQRPALPVHI